MGVRQLIDEVKAKAARVTELGTYTPGLTAEEQEVRKEEMRKLLGKEPVGVMPIPPSDQSAFANASVEPTERAKSEIARLQSMGTGPQDLAVARALAQREALRRRQLAATGRLETVASGQAPTIAEQLEQRQREQAARAVRQQLASARGGFDPSLQASATQGLSQVHADIGQQVGIQAAQERRQAAQDVASQLGLVGQQDLSQVQQALAREQAGQQFVLGRERLGLGQEQLGLEAQQFADKSKMTLEELLMNRDLEMLRLRLGQEAAEQARTDALITGGLKGISDVTSAALSRS